MELEDPISDKFRTLIESLMAKTTSEIVKVFAEVLFETRVEISHSWREIEELKQKLEESEGQRAEVVVRSETTVNFKREIEEVVVSHVRPQLEVSDASTVCPADRGSKGEVQVAKAATIENTGSVMVHEPVTSQTTLDTSGINQSINSPDQSQKTQVSQTAVKRNRGRPAKSTRVAELQNCIKQADVVSKSQLQAISVADTEQPSSSTGIIILSKRRGKKGAVVTKKKYIQKNVASTSSVGATHTLRDRHLLNNQKPCSCISSPQSSLQEKRPKAPISQVYTCSKCGHKVQDGMQFKSHKCSTLHECNRCGQTFKNLRNLATHRRRILPSTKPFPYCCYLCGHMFATQCGWSLHKRIHTHSNLAETAQQEPQPPQLLTLPKELKAKVEVRLERISDAQLEAALCPKNVLLQGEKNSQLITMVPNLPSADSVMDTLVSCKESGAQTMTKAILGSISITGTGENVNKTGERTRDLVIPTASSQIQPPKKEIFAKLWPVPSADSGECKEGSSGGSDGLRKGLNSLSRKRKMSDCSHDVYNGMFPVEKILRWRNTKWGKMEKHVGAS